MSNSTIGIKEIRSKFIQVIIIEFSPLLLFDWLETSIKNLSEGIQISITLLMFSIFLHGCRLCWVFANNYAKYKGYKNYFYVYSILNIFGLSILFLLKNRNLSENTGSNQDPLLNFSISSIFISWFAIPILFTVPIFLTGFYLGIQGFDEYISNNKDFSAILNIPILVVFIWYFVREFKRSNIDYKHILGSLNKIDLKLPIILTVTQYFFAWGMNSLTFYGLSFVVPKYVENQINQENATTIVGWFCFAIGALFFAPLMEELICRGILLQKLAIEKNIIKGLMISAIAFALMHFRCDVIPLFVMGIILSLLYLKTKQLAMPILCHFLYNLMACVTNIYDQYFSGVDSSVKITVTEYQQQFLDTWELSILFIALSAPYLTYFIYKNFPRNYDLQRLPYFANQLNSSRN